MYVISLRLVHWTNQWQMSSNSQGYPELAALLQDVLAEEEAQNQPVCYFQKAGILMCTWRPPTVPSSEEWEVSYQIVVPQTADLIY